VDLGRATVSATLLALIALRNGLATVTKSDMGSAAHSIRSETASHRSPGMEMRADTCFTTTRLVSIAHSQGERDR
jgi:hypothetical protein